MAKPRPPQIKPRKESSVGKWIFILILCGAATGAYFKRDQIAEKIHTMVHGEQQPADQPLVPPAAAVSPVPPAPMPAPVSTPDNPCGAFANDPARNAVCQDQQKKIQRMRDDAKARDKAFQAPPPPAGAAGSEQQPSGTNTTGH